MQRQVRTFLCALAALGLAAVAEARGHSGTADFDHCFEHHAARFDLGADLLRGIARVESGMRPTAINNSHFQRTRTRDVGLMQINTSLLPRLARYGITEDDLLQPCTSIEVGAWVLSDVLRRHGNSWAAVGAYNAACTTLRGQACTDARSRYAWSVFKKMQVPKRAAAGPIVAPTDPTGIRRSTERHPALIQVVQLDASGNGAAP